MHGTIVGALRYACKTFADREAIAFGDQRISYAELGARTNQTARALVSLGNEPGNGAEPGDRVAMLVPNCPEFLYTAYGIWSSGLAWTQLQPLGGVESWRHCLNDARVSTLVYHAGFADAVEALKPGLETVRHFVTIAGGDQGNDPDLMQLAEKEDDSFPDFGVTTQTVHSVGYSSGTTGLPKGIVWTAGSWWNALVAFMLEMPEILGGRFMHVAPLTHMTSIFVLPTWIRGGSNVLLTGLDPSLWFSTIEKEKITGTAIVPTILYMLMENPAISEHDLSTLETMVYGGSPMAPEKLKQGLEVFGRIFLQGYACSEGGAISVLPKRDHTPDRPDRLGSAGRPVVTAEVLLVDPESGEPVPEGEPGEIAVRSSHHMASYWDPSKNAETMRPDGYVLTGDIGKFDADGYLTIVDRKKDIIITGGFNIFPRDVEDVIFEHPAVQEVAVIGVPDEKWGEAIKACVVLKYGQQASAEEIIALVKQKKGSVYAPKSVDFVPAIPQTPQGKHDKKVLRAPHWKGTQRAVH
ncbi:MAG: AMP-binding protein [Actinomycetota bacterium]